MHRDVIQICKDYPHCTNFGKNLNSNVSFNSSQPLPTLLGAKEKVQLDYAGPLQNYSGNQIYILVAIDRYSKDPSALLTCSTSWSCISIIIAPLYQIKQASIQDLKISWLSSFDRRKILPFASLQLCPMGDHQDCGLVKRTIQTVKRLLGAAKLSPDFTNIQDTFQQFIEDILVTKKSVAGLSPFEIQFGRVSNTELSITESFIAECLSSHVNLDEQQLIRDLLTSEQRRKQCDSRPRIKVVRKGKSGPSS